MTTDRTLTISVPAIPSVGIIARQSGAGARYSAMIDDAEINHMDDSKPPSYQQMLAYLISIENVLLEKLNDVPNPEGIVRQLRIAIQVKIPRR